MAKREQVFIRAMNKDGKWDSVDILDLDETSFRALVIDKFMELGLLVGLSDEISGNEIILIEKGED